jgi:hypothetical protein
MVFPVVGGSQLVDTGYEISNSLRFKRTDDPNLEKTFSGSPTSTTKCTISFWTKLGDPSDTNAKNIFSAIKSGSNEDFIKFMGVNNGILNNLELGFNNTNDGTMMVSEGTTSFVKFRDPFAWYHIVIAIDSTQGTASNRVKVYVNGTQFDVELRVEGGSSTTDVPLDQNYALGFLTASKHQIGENVDGSSEHYDGYLSEFFFVDGQQYAPTVFGETNDNGVWIPKDAKDDISFGNYGFYLEFKQTGTSANSSGMGADTSGNDNHFSASGLNDRDVVVDTPTNNFMVMNPLFTNSRGSFTEGNCQVTTDVQGSVPYGQVEFGSFPVNKGKWYYEAVPSAVGSGGQLALGWNERAEDGHYTNGHNNLGSNGNVWYGSSGKFQDGGTSNTTSPNSYTDDDIIGMAIDFDNKKFYAHKNGTYQSNGTGTGDPSNGTNGFTFNTHYNDYWVPWMSKDDTNHEATVKFNFGNPVTTISSGNADANGYGNFEYAVPTGFYSLCSKNLAEYG